MHTVGVIGAGNMGGGMVERLREQGWPVVVCDIDPAALERALQVGATLAATPALLAAQCRTVIVCVVDAEQTRHVLLDPDQGVVATAPGQDAAVLLCPTIAPGDAEQLARGLAERGWPCLEAPMSGGPQRARDGSMSLMLAGAPALLRSREALLAVLSSQRFELGERVGDGARTKLVNNLLAGINLAGAAEVLALAERLGLDLIRTLDVIERSSGQSWIGSDRMRRALADDYAPRAHTTLLAKDTALALDAAREVGLSPRLGHEAAAAFRDALERGLAELDDASLLKLMRVR